MFISGFIQAIMSLSGSGHREPIRVIHAVARMDRGGIETFLMRVYRYVDRSRVQFDFLVHKGAPGTYDEEILHMGGRVYSIGFSYDPFALPRYLVDLKRFFRSHPEYRIAHAHLNAFNGIFLRVAENSNVPERIAHIHTQSSGVRIREPLWNLVKIIGRNAFTRRFACSRRAASWAYGSRAPFQLIRNGIPLSVFGFDSQARSQIRQQYGLGGRLVIGHVGSFRRDKNQLFLLEVLKEIRKREGQAALLLVGEGSEEYHVRARAGQLDLSQNVIFAGDTPHPEKYFSAMDVFAFPSIDEGLGIAAIEAQASGLPCVMSTGVPEEAAATKLAIRLPLKNNNNCEQWAASILRFAGQDPQREYMRTGLEVFDIRETARELEQVYLGAFSNQAPP